MWSQNDPPSFRQQYKNGIPYFWLYAEFTIANLRSTFNSILLNWIEHEMQYICDCSVVKQRENVWPFVTLNHLKIHPKNVIGSMRHCVNWNKFPFFVWKHLRSTFCTKQAVQFRKICYSMFQPKLSEQRNEVINDKCGVQLQENSFNWIVV